MTPSTRRITIPGRLPGLNEIISTTRLNRFAGASQKKKQTAYCLFWIKAAKLKPVTKPVWIHFDWHEPNAKRDPDNIRAGGAKFILDALVEAGILPSDGSKWIKGLSDEFYVSGPRNERVEVKIESVI